MFIYGIRMGWRGVRNLSSECLLTLLLILNPFLNTPSQAEQAQIIIEEEEAILFGSAPATGADPNVIEFKSESLPNTFRFFAEPYFNVKNVGPFAGEVRIVDEFGNLYGGSTLLQGNEFFENLGFAIKVLPTVNSSGSGLVAISAPGAKNDVGLVRIYSTEQLLLGGANALKCILDPTLFVQTNKGEQFGYSLATISPTSENVFLAVGSPGANASSGRVDIFEITTNGCNPIPKISLTGEHTGDLFGFSVSNIGDVNGDGYPDLAIGAPSTFILGLGQVGKVYAFSGKDFSSLGTISYPQSAKTKPSPGARFGHAIFGAGDTNGDGRSEILIGAPYQKVKSQEGEYISGQVSIHAFNFNGTWSEIQFFSNLTSESQFGFALASTVGPSGLILIGAPLASLEAESSGGIYAYSHSSNSQYQMVDSLGGDQDDSRFGTNITNLLATPLGNQRFSVNSQTKFSSSLLPEIRTFKAPLTTTPVKAKLEVIAPGCATKGNKKPSISFKNYKLDKSSQCASDESKCKDMVITGHGIAKNTAVLCTLGLAPLSVPQLVNTEYNCQETIDQDQPFQLFSAKSNKKGKLKTKLAASTEELDGVFTGIKAHPKYQGLETFLQCFVGAQIKPDGKLEFVDPKNLAISPTLKIKFGVK